MKVRTKMIVGGNRRDWRMLVITVGKININALIIQMPIVQLNLSLGSNK